MQFKFYFPNIIHELHIYILVYCILKYLWLLKCFLKKKNKNGVPVMAQQKGIGIHEDIGLIPGLVQWVKDLVLL